MRCTRRHVQMSFVPIKMLMKNNLSFERIIAACNALVEGMEGMPLLGAAGGGTGAVSIGKVETTSSIISTALYCLASGSDLHNSSLSLLFKADNVGQQNPLLGIRRLAKVRTSCVLYGQRGQNRLNAIPASLNALVKIGL